MAHMKEPICLIENRENGDLVVNPEAEEILSAINQPVVVVAIVGKYRTGKSYLMNKLAGCSNGFALGSTIQSKTKGIWMWCLPHPSQPGHTLVLLDTEGLGDVEKGDSKNDAWIFSLAVLLSSTMVFNSVGTIDQNSMEQLNYVTELTERIKVKSNTGKNDDDDDDDGSSEMKRFFPAFIWCVRDFSLQLEINGSSITEDQYLQNSLKLKKGIGAKVNEYNTPRECIRHFFHSHKCFVFERPASTTGLQQLESLSEAELEPGFLKQTQKFCTHVYETSTTKTVTNGLKVTGKLLYDLAVTYVGAIQSGAVPCMENAVKVLSQIENSRAVSQALSKYEEEMSKRVSHFPTETQEQFLQLHQECEKQALAVFMDISFKDEDLEYHKTLIHNLSEKAEIFLKDNLEKSVQKCQYLLEELNKPLETGIRQGKYSKPGGHNVFKTEKQNLIVSYQQHPGKGMKANEVLKKFLNEKEKIETTILQTDQSLTENEKMMAAQKAQSEAVEREKKIVEENNRRLQETMEAEKKSQEEQLAMIQEKNEQDRNKLIEENKWLIEEKMKEKENMMKEGMKKQCEMLEYEIQQLKKQQEEASQGSFLGNVISGILPGVLSSIVKKIF
ncbi:guanylate-binding protein 1-like isoform X2 [Pelobates fuscus]|uniref:guanylate-binding protein 1-like isoform X2 n=1 Tax=Pelobates fuscus TaxID=191477 RepID=UPI002FE4D134